MDGTKSIDRNDDGSPATAESRRYADRSKTPSREKTQEGVVREAGHGAVDMWWDVDGDHRPKASAIAQGSNCSYGEFYRPGLYSRVCQHVERFVKETDRSMTEGRHLAQLLQLEFRDFARRSEEMEAETACLRSRIRQMERCRREKDVINRGSFAGIVLAHSDASAQLRSRLEIADRKIKKSEGKKKALVDQLNAKESTIAELERKVAQLVTSARVKHERENRARRTWEQRISAKWEAYWSVRCGRKPTSAEVPSTIWKGCSKTNPGAAREEAAAAAAVRAACPLAPKEAASSTTHEDRVFAKDGGHHHQLQASEEERVEETAATGTAIAASTSCRRCCSCCSCCSCHTRCCGKGEVNTSRTHCSWRRTTPSEADIASPGASHRRARHRSNPAASSRVSRTSRARELGSSALWASSEEEDEEEEEEEEVFSKPTSAIHFSSDGRGRSVEHKLGGAAVLRPRGSSDQQQRVSPGAAMLHQPTTRQWEQDDLALGASRLRNIDGCERRKGTCSMNTSTISKTSSISSHSTAPLLTPDDTGDGNSIVRSRGRAPDLTDPRIDGEEDDRGIARSPIPALGRDRIVYEDARGTSRPQCGSWFGYENGVEGIGTRTHPSVWQQHQFRVTSQSHQQQHQREVFQRWTGPSSSDTTQTAERQRRKQHEQGACPRNSTKKKLRTPTTASVTAATDDTSRQPPRSSRVAFDRRQKRGQKCAEGDASGGRGGKPQGQSTKAPATASSLSIAGNDRRGLPRAGGEPELGGISIAPAPGADERHLRRPRQRREHGQEEKRGDFATAAEVAAAAAAAAAAFGASQVEVGTVSSPLFHHSRRQGSEGQRQQQQQQQYWLDKHHQQHHRRPHENHHEQEEEQLSSLSGLSWATRVRTPPEWDRCSASSRRGRLESGGPSVATSTVDPTASRQASPNCGTAFRESHSQQSPLSTKSGSSFSSSGASGSRQLPRHRQQQREQVAGQGGPATPSTYPSYVSSPGPECAPTGRWTSSSPMPGSGDENTTYSCPPRIIRSHLATADRSPSPFVRRRAPAAAATQTAGTASSPFRTSRCGSSSNPSRVCRTGHGTGFDSSSRWSTGSSASVRSNCSGGPSASSSGWTPASPRSKSGLISGGSGQGDDGDDHADDGGGVGVSGNGLGGDEKRTGCCEYELTKQKSTRQTGQCPAGNKSTLSPTAGARALIEAW